MTFSIYTFFGALQVGANTNRLGVVEKKGELICLQLTIM